MIKIGLSVEIATYHCIRWKKNNFLKCLKHHITMMLLIVVKAHEIFIPIIIVPEVLGIHGHIG